MAARNDPGDDMQATERVTANEGRPSAAKSIETVQAREILGSSGLLRIDLDGEIYTLRLTRNQRLILTK